MTIEEDNKKYLKETSIRSICVHCGKRFYHYDKNTITPQYYIRNKDMKCCDNPTIVLNIDEARKIKR